MKASERYRELASQRSMALDRARRFSEVTIPTLIPRDGQTDTSWTPQAYQSFGAMCVVSLASRLTTALVPPGAPGFVIKGDPRMLAEAQLEELPPETKRALAMIEEFARLETEARDWRGQTNIIEQHLVVAGNVGELQLGDNSLIPIPLWQYAVVRAPDGQVVEWIVEQPVHERALTPKLQELVPVVAPAVTGVDGKVYALHTWGRLINGRFWEIDQYFGDTLVPGSSMKRKHSPFRAYWWTAELGSNYGRSKIEEHYADFLSLEMASKSLREQAAIAGWHAIGVAPNAAGGINLRRRLARARTGDMLTMNRDDVFPVKFDNLTNVQTVTMFVEGLERRLGAAFLLSGVTVRNAERVTAFEIGKLAQEIEYTLGGVYSAQAAQIVRPRAELMIANMSESGQFQWPDKGFQLTITAGLEALNREQDAARTAQFVQAVSGLPREVLLSSVKWSDILNDYAVALGKQGRVYSEEEANQRMMEQMAAQQMAAAPQQNGSA